MWVANTDSEEEGVFKDFYNGQLVDYAPWPPDRPYAGGFRYNCMLLRVRKDGEGRVIPEFLGCHGRHWGRASSSFEGHYP